MPGVMRRNPVGGGGFMLFSLRKRKEIPFAEPTFYLTMVEGKGILINSRS
jgi:hypothetical protein